MPLTKQPKQPNRKRPDRTAALSAEPLPTVRSDGDVVQGFEQATKPAETRRSLETALRYWACWHELRFGVPLPLLQESPEAIPVETYRSFLHDHTPEAALRAQGRSETELAKLSELKNAMVQRGVLRDLGPLKSATIKQRFAMIRAAHRMFNVVPVSDGGAVRAWLTALDSYYVAFDTDRMATQKKGVEPWDLMDMLDALDDTPAGWRDAAILACGWASGGRRRSEIVEMRLKDLVPRKGALGAAESYVWGVPRTKTKKSTVRGKHVLRVPVVDLAAKALNRWLEWLMRQGATEPEQQVFVRLFPRKDAEPVIGKPLRPQAVWSLVKQVAAKTGRSPADYGAHSLRRGFATEAAMKHPTPAVMEMTGHASVTGLMRYIEPAGENNPAASTLTAALAAGPRS